MTTRRGRWASLLGLAVIVALWTSVAGRWLVVDLPLDRPDAILSLASHEWERLPDAARLARQYPSARLVLSVPRSINRYNCHRCGERAQRLWELGVLNDRIDLMPHRVDRTLDEAVAARKYMLEHKYSRLMVVTSPYHTRRAWLTFRHVLRDSGIALGIFPTTRQSKAVPPKWWSRRYDRNYVKYEWAAIVYYRVRYGVPAVGGWL